MQNIKYRLKPLSTYTLGCRKHLDWNASILYLNFYSIIINIILCNFSHLAYTAIYCSIKLSLDDTRYDWRCNHMVRRMIIKIKLYSFRQVFRNVLRLSFCLLACCFHTIFSVGFHIYCFKWFL